VSVGSVACGCDLSPLPSYLTLLTTTTLFPIPPPREARWEAYFTLRAEEEKREAERLYQW
jgi:hypothetical protein